MVVPSAKEIRLVGNQKEDFSVVAPQLWNSFSLEVCLSLSLLSFQKKLVNTELLGWVVL